MSEMKGIKQNFEEYLHFIVHNKIKKQTIKINTCSFKFNGTVQRPPPGQLLQLPQPLLDFLLVQLIDWTRCVLRFSCFSSVLQIKGKLAQLFGFQACIFLASKGTFRAVGIWKLNESKLRTKTTTRWEKQLSCNKKRIW